MVASDCRGVADIVDRLRATELQSWKLDCEAADEIERLRAELKREHEDHAQTIEDAAQVARELASLREKSKRDEVLLQQALDAIDRRHREQSYQMPDYLCAVVAALHDRLE